MGRPSAPTLAVVSDLVERLIERTPRPVRPGVELVVRTVVDTFHDRVPGLAAEMAFYLILSLAPLLITVFAGIAVFGDLAGVEVVDNAARQIETVASRFLTDSAAEDFLEVVTEVEAQAQGLQALLSFGFVLTVLSASRAFRVTTIAITIAYDLEQTRPGWKQALYGLAMTIAGVVLGLVVLPLFVGGPGLGRQLVDRFGVPSQLGAVWEVAYWPLAALVATLLLSVLYHVAAPWWTPWRRDLPGAVLAMLIGLLGSVGLRAYATQAIGGGDSLFGPLAAPIVVLLWLYIMSLAVLLGAEFNSEIERMWPTAHPDQPAEAEQERLRAPDRVG